VLRLQFLNFSVGDGRLSMTKTIPGSRPRPFRLEMDLLSKIALRAFRVVEKLYLHLLLAYQTRCGMVLLPFCS
jgi:hypothetical protein